MIHSQHEYELAQAELLRLEEWLKRLQSEHPAPTKGLTKAGVRKMIARLQEELAIYEGTQEVDTAKP